MLACKVRASVNDPVLAQISRRNNYQTHFFHNAIYLFCGGCHTLVTKSFELTMPTEVSIALRVDAGIDRPYLQSCHSEVKQV